MSTGSGQWERFESWKTAVKKWVADRADRPELMVDFQASSTNCVLFCEGHYGDDSLDLRRDL